MKLSQLKDLTAPVIVEYQGLQFELEVFTERFYDEECKAQAEASVPPVALAEPVEPAALAADARAAERLAHSREVTAYSEAVTAFVAASRERRKATDAAFMAPSSNRGKRAAKRSTARTDSRSPSRLRTSGATATCCPPFSSAPSRRR